MVRFILAFFGYIKIPKEVVFLSIEQERFLEKCLDAEQDDRGKTLFALYLDGQRTLTNFLRSGRLQPPTGGGG